jgi:hypothetical protein
VLLKNDGGGTLRIKAVDTGCPCLSFRLSRQEIGPAEEANLTLTATIRTAGQHLQFPVRIMSDDPDSPQTVVGVRARGAPPPLQLTPERVDFPEVPAGTGPVQRLSLKAAAGKARPAPDEVAVTSAEGLVSAEVEAQRGDDPAESAVIAVRPRADLATGPFTDTLTIRVAVLDYAAQVPVRGTVVPLLVASPKAVLFGNIVRGSPPRHRDIEVRRTDGKALADLAKTSAPPGLRVEEADPTSTARGKPGRTLRIGLDPAALKEDVKGAEIRLWFAGEPQPVAVKVSAFLARPDGPARR